MENEALLPEIDIEFLKEKGFDRDQIHCEVYF